MKEIGAITVVDKNSDSEPMFLPDGIAITEALDDERMLIGTVNGEPGKTYIPFHAIKYANFELVDVDPPEVEDDTCVTSGGGGGGCNGMAIYRNNRPSDYVIINSGDVLSEPTMVICLPYPLPSDISLDDAVAPVKGESSDEGVAVVNIMPIGFRVSGAPQSQPQTATADITLEFANGCVFTFGYMVTR